MASPVDTSVKFYRNDFPGAPALSGTVGSFIGLADACLVNGFGLRTATSLVVSGGVATVTLPSDANNGNLLDSVILVAGVTGTLTALNGEQKVTEASSTTLKFATAAADGTATGTITIKTAAAGWQKVFSGTNRAVYRSTNVAGSRFYLRVIDTATTEVSVRGYETMTDVNTGTGLFPSSAEFPSGAYWAKSVSASATANPWDFFADSRTLIFCPVAGFSSQSDYAGQGAYFFGDFISFKSVDSFASGITGHTSAPGSYAYYGSIATLSNNGFRIARSHVGLGSAVQGYLWPASGATSSSSHTGDSQLGTYPPATDGVLRLSKLHVNQGDIFGVNAVLRGFIPGFLWVPMRNTGSSFQRGDRLVGGGDLVGKKLYCVFTATSYNEYSTQTDQRAFIDITGPWR